MNCWVKLEPLLCRSSSPNHPSNGVGPPLGWDTTLPERVEECWLAVWMIRRRIRSTRLETAQVNTSCRLRPATSLGLVWLMPGPCDVLRQGTGST